MSEPVTQGQFFEAMRQQSASFEERHRHIREDIKDGFQALTEKIDEHVKEDRVVADAVLRIQTERKIEKDAAVKRGTWAGMAGAAALTIVVESIKKIFSGSH